MRSVTEPADSGPGRHKNDARSLGRRVESEKENTSRRVEFDRSLTLRGAVESRTRRCAMRFAVIVRRTHMSAGVGGDEDVGTPHEGQATCFAPCCQLALPARYVAFRSPRTRSLSPVMPRSFDVDCHAHPRMNTALKMMLALRQTRDLQLAALKDTSPGHRDVLKAAGTFGNRRLSSIERRYETAPEFRHLSEGVRLTTLVHYDKGSAFPDRDTVGLEVPARVWSSSRCLCK